MVFALSISFLWSIFTFRKLLSENVQTINHTMLLDAMNICMIRKIEWNFARPQFVNAFICVLIQTYA